MAGFCYNGMDSLIADFDKLAKLSDEDRATILSAGATQIRFHQQKYLAQNHHRTGDLEKSIRSEIIGDVAVISPRGTEMRKKRRKILSSHKGSGAMKRQRHHGSTKASTNMEVGFYLEYGTPRMKAMHWMENANSIAEPDMENAMQEAWNERLEKLNL